MVSAVAVELTPDATVAFMAALAAWVRIEEQRVTIMIAAGCSRHQVRELMAFESEN